LPEEVGRFNFTVIVITPGSPLVLQLAFVETILVPFVPVPVT